MERRRPRRTDDTSRGAEVAAREAAGLLTYYGRRYPLATAVVLVVALVVGLGWYWHQQRILNQQREQQARQTQTLPQPVPTPAPAPRPAPDDDRSSTASSSFPASPSGPSEGAVNLLLGNPSGATSDPASRDNYLMVKRHYALSYNNSRGTPNWVSWRVTAADLGDAPRKRQFDPDPDLPAASTASATATMPAAASTAATCAPTATGRTRRRRASPPSS